MTQNNAIAGDPEHSTLTRFQSAAARALLSRLSTECRAYCILTGYERLPESFDTDIDFMVDNHDLERIPRIVKEVADEIGMRLFQTIPHELSARAYLLVAQTGGELTFIQPDSTSDYRHFGSLWLRADEMLASRRMHPKGFWIPGAAYEFIYYLIKRLNKRDFRAQHGARLHELYREDPATCDQLLGRYWGGKQRASLSEMAASGDWSGLIENVDPVRAELMRNSLDSPKQRLFSIGERVGHFIDRLRRPTGGLIAFMGPDGCGKSSVIEAISSAFTPGFRGVDNFHLMPKSLRKIRASTGSVTDPHGQAPWGIFGSIAKLCYMVGDYFLGYFTRIRPAMIRTRLVIFDRYIYDLLVDSKRVRYGGPGSLMIRAARLVPRPGLVILLDAPPEVLWSRKQEVAFEEVVRQRSDYLRVAGLLPSAVVVNAAQPLPDVLHDVAEAIISYFADRTARRLGLERT